MITKTTKIDRRSFILGTAAVGSGLALGLKIPFGTSVVRAQGATPEINAGAWFPCWRTGRRRRRESFCILLAADRCPERPTWA